MNPTLEDCVTDMGEKGFGDTEETLEDSDDVAGMHHSTRILSLLLLLQPKKYCLRNSQLSCQMLILF